MSNKEKLMTIIKKNNGYVRTSDLRQHGIHQQFLRQLVDEGYIKKVTRGVYSLTGQSPNEFFILGQRYLSGVFSHNTALYFYDMTERTPIKYDMTFPNNIRIYNEFVKAHYIKKEIYSLGLTTIKLSDNTEIKIYDKERTICDIVKDRNKIDTQILNTALKEYMKRKDKNLFLLYNYASKLRIESILSQYMEVLDE
ncbi:MAG: type IV toxin-antitoxin system AbiEi family antitoxin domain-containing protein [Clostridiales bacterium]|nr:type IV toxin-antitoxin system AbiEi family antitoxin domain-containing protein [Clostridiales bacterium]